MEKRKKKVWNRIDSSESEDEGYVPKATEFCRSTQAASESSIGTSLKSSGYIGKLIIELITKR